MAVAIARPDERSEEDEVSDDSKPWREPTPDEAVALALFQRNNTQVPDIVAALRAARRREREAIVRRLRGRLKAQGVGMEQLRHDAEQVRLCGIRGFGRRTLSGVLVELLDAIEAENGEGGGDGG
jgi:hypothetical protein